MKQRTANAARVALAAAGLAVACSSTSNESRTVAAPGPPCATNADCAAPQVCSFLLADGCAAVGHCIPPPAKCASTLVCPCKQDAPTTACSDGTSVPLAVTGNRSCVEGAAGQACVDDGDCAPPLRCGYPLADGCKATGVCTEMSSCSVFPQDACSCDGTPLAIEPCGAGGAYALLPIAPGPCVPDAGSNEDPDAGPDAGGPCIRQVLPTGATCCTNEGAPCAGEGDCCNALVCRSGRCDLCGTAGEFCNGDGECCATANLHCLNHQCG